MRVHPDAQDNHAGYPKDECTGLRVGGWTKEGVNARIIVDEEHEDRSGEAKLKKWSSRERSPCEIVEKFEDFEK